MAKINKRDIYRPKELLSLNDFLIASDSDNNLKTITISVSSLLEFFNNINNEFSTTYTYQLNETGDSIEDGIFSSDNLSISNSVNFKISKASNSGLNLVPYLELINSNNNLFTIEISEGNYNNIGFFIINNSTLEADNILSLNLTSVGNTPNGVFENNKEYNISISTKSKSSSTQQVTATTGQTQITLNESSNNIDVWVDRVFQIQDIDYTLINNDVIFTEPLFEGSIINIRMF